MSPNRPRHLPSFSYTCFYAFFRCASNCSAAAAQTHNLAAPTSLPPFRIFAAHSLTVFRLHTGTHAHHFSCRFVQYVIRHGFFVAKGHDQSLPSWPIQRHCA
ncbi:hypothetical protein K437DRAFT_106318 [Tilletiaria anomala UBC 951]|uniref:Uncharacterized protein n=1 Tax=Tilletiaria anomala (strain ATCC 24038 / CBS 436.72 / UBC 951) TaxID=1037660 RepID=A0A066VYQ5_TILAU|nr:uncharacterized protein K437DRAFT_106318 [Tilletiaria anomala UBC 951]KDN46636.1 hypothetical protein K437DRAFT_106318 [Tilletiaria anomala UBC 951]